MRISDKVKRAIQDNRKSRYMIDPLEIGEVAIQAYLSEIWKPFDAEDESTWTREDYKPFLVQGGMAVFRCGKWYSCMEGDPPYYRELQWTPTHYLDPADILPKEDK